MELQKGLKTIPPTPSPPVNAVGMQNDVHFWKYIHMHPIHPIQNLKLGMRTAECVDLQELVDVLCDPWLVMAHVPLVAAVAEPRVDGLVHIDQVGRQVPPVRIPRQSLVVVVDGEGTVFEEQRKLTGATRTCTAATAGGL